MGPSNPSNPNTTPNPNQQPISSEQPQSSLEAKTAVPVAPEMQPPTGGQPQAQTPPPVPVADPELAGSTAAGSVQTPPTPPSANPGAPASAEDVDVIEKEWVDQANKIIEQTKDDPYTEEEAVQALQVDYLQKRYGHNVKKTGGD
jgi:hypothetical protein